VETVQGDSVGILVCNLRTCVQVHTVTEELGMCIEYLLTYGNIHSNTATEDTTSGYGYITRLEV
jgi:hypothetical protein